VTSHWQCACQLVAVDKCITLAAIPHLFALITLAVGAFMCLAAQHRGGIHKPAWTPPATPAAAWPLLLYQQLAEPHLLQQHLPELHLLHQRQHELVVVVLTLLLLLLLQRAMHLLGAVVWPDWDWQALL